MGDNKIMKWIEADLEKYIQAKEYVDTILIPLLPFQLSQDADMSRMAFQCEVQSIFVNELEKDLTGRVLLTPSYYYNKKAEKSIESNRINSWVEDALTQPFKHVFLITFDASWKKVEKELDGNLLWLPNNHSVGIHTKEMVTIIRDQVNEVGELIRSYW